MKLPLTIVYLILFAIFSILSTEAQVVMTDGVPRDTSFTLYQTYIKEKKARPYIQPVYPEMKVGLQMWENYTYLFLPSRGNKKGDRELKMNIYRPADKQKYPALLMIHGGGWNSGDKSLQIPLAMEIASRGYVAIPVEYRLIPEALYPAGVNDLEYAVKWIRKNAKKFGIDKNKIAVSGCSAGGQLACLLGTRNLSGIIKAVINIDGISTFIDSTTVKRARDSRNAGGKMPVDAIWLGGAFEDAPENWQAASALTHVSQKSAPVCFINSSIPRFHNGRDELIDHLSVLGIYSETHVFPDTPHPFWFFHPWFHPTVDYTVSFLDKVFKR